MSSIQATVLPNEKLKEPLENISNKDIISFSFNNTEAYLESSFDTSFLDKSINEISQDKISEFSNLTLELKKRSNQPINLKLIKENVTLKRKINSLSQLPDIISTLNKSSCENISTQTKHDDVEGTTVATFTQTENIQIDTDTQTDKNTQDLDEMIRVIQQFKTEKEKFQVKVY